MRLSEIYTSVQGEGPRVGIPTVFVRFAGCNLRCPGWPCDTQFAIDPKLYRSEWKTFDAKQVLNQIEEQCWKYNVNHICFTGGEPFLQQHEELRELTGYLLENGRKLECFSNGTIEYPDWAQEAIKFIMDWKLPGSGESHTDPVRIHNLKNLNQAPSNRGHAVKFVLKTYEDFNVALRLYNEYKRYMKNIEVFYGRVWDSRNTDADFVEKVLDNGLSWRLNVQVHNYIWDRNKRGI